MRRFIPRFLNVLTFILTLLVFIPWSLITKGFDFLSTKLGLTFLESVNDVLTKYTGVKLLAIPCLFVVVSFIYLFVALIDRGIKKHNKETSRPIENMIYAPLYFIGLTMSLIGIISCLFATLTSSDPFIFKETDYFGLGKFIQMIPSVDTALSLFGVFFIALFVLQLVFSLSLRKTYKRGFFAKFFTWFLFLVLAFLSYKGLSDFFVTQGTFMETVNSIIGGSGVVPVERELFNFEMYIYIVLPLMALIAYIVIGSTRCKKYNKQVKAQKAKANAGSEIEEETTQEETKEAEKKNPNMVPYVSPFESTEKIDDPLYIEPKPEQVIETELVEQTVVKQVVYEESNLDMIYSHEFGFKNCTMVKGDGFTDYYVNRVKFLTLSNHNKTMVFRLELDKAIRLIMDIPTIGKDKYENHRIWFKVEDASVLSIDTITGIITDAYNTVLNNL